MCSELWRCCLLVLLLCNVFPLSATTAEPAAGKTIMARGEVVANAAQSSRPLQRRAPVYHQDVLQTGVASAGQFRMGDGGLLSLQAETVLAVQQYQLAADGSADNVQLELLEGGLRTITGALPPQGRQYQLRTPVATLGVRGTHYEAVLRQGDLYLAGWDGSIDIVVTVPGSDQQFSLGPSQPFRFAVVRRDGSVEFLLKAPTLFAGAPTAELAQTVVPAGADNPQSIAADSSSADNNSSADKNSALIRRVYALPARPGAGLAQLLASRSQPVVRQLPFDQTGVDPLDNRSFTANWSIEPVSRQGLAEFNHLAQHSLQSSVGELSNLRLSMQLDFDRLWVPAGELSFTDAGGEWFAVFNGVFADGMLDLAVHFASHGQQLASGQIAGFLWQDASAIFGNVTLQEQANPTVRLDGSFVLTEQP